MTVTVDLDDLLYVMVSSEGDTPAVRAARKSLLDAVFEAIDQEEALAS